MTAIGILFGFIALYLVWRTIQIIFRRDWVVKYRIYQGYMQHSNGMIVVSAITKRGASWKADRIFYPPGIRRLGPVYAITDIAPDRPERRRIRP